MTRLALITAVVVATLSGIAVVWQLRNVVLIFLLSLGIAAALRPVVEKLAHSGLPKWLGLVGTYVVGTAILGVFLMWLAGQLLAEIQHIGDASVLMFDHIAAEWPAGTPFQRAVARRLPPPEQLYAFFTDEQRNGVLETALGTALTVFEAGANLVVVIALSIYWTIDYVHFERLWLSLLPVQQRSIGRDIWRAIEVDVGAYLRSELVQSTLAGLLLGLGYWIIGFPYPVLMAFLGALAWLIPWVGSVLAVMALWLLSPPEFVLGGTTHGAVTVGLATAHTLTVLIVLEFAVEPRLFRRHRYNSLLMAVLVIGLADIYGMFGLLLGPPLTVAIQVLGEQLLRLRVSATAPIPAIAPSNETESMSLRTLEERVDALSKSVGALPEPAPELRSIVDRLCLLVEGAQEVKPATTDEECVARPSNEGAAVSPERS